MHTISDTLEWQDLEAHATVMKQQHLFDLFQEEDGRTRRFSLDLGDMLFDFSRQLIRAETLVKLVALANAADVEAWRDRMFAGEKINITENRAVLHTALRNQGNQPVHVDGHDIMQDVRAASAKMKAFTEDVRSGGWRGIKGDRITDVVNIGIGGSDLGPKLVTDALIDTVGSPLPVHFVSNVDGTQISRVLSGLDPATTLFVIASKTFTTKETMINAHTARTWLIGAAGDPNAVARHFVATTAAPAMAAEFGIAAENIFESWDWVGGRFSLWSAIGLPIALSLGYETFEELLAGAHDLDQHFLTRPLAENAPVILALMGIWNTNFLGTKTQAILPYDQALSLFPAYMQQAEMESNGKSTTRDNLPVSHSTCPIVWGSTGINGQHAFYQLLHQGTEIIPCDFIGSVEPQVPREGHHQYLMANFFAQIQALTMGNADDHVREDLRSKGLSAAQVEALLPHKRHDGNRPSNCLLLDRVTARTLGKLIALYEHKIFVQGLIWQICSFDQWGVELGKVMANGILEKFERDAGALDQNGCVDSLIQVYRQKRVAR